MAKSKRSPLPRHRRLRPRAELVEERILLSPFVVSNTQDSGSGSLRQAILDADSSLAKATINFAISPAGSHEIDLLSALPQIRVPVLLDGTSQPGYAGTPIIEINGGGATMTGDGLLLAAGSDGSTIQGLAIAGFPDNSFSDGAGIHIFSNGNLVQSNFLGTDLTGKAAGPNFFGVFIDGSSNNTIGGTIGGTGSLGNLISGNLYDGVLILDDAQPAQNNLVVGNKIGTDITGAAGLPNGLPNNNGDGIDVYASNNTIGGATSAASNLISANEGYGIYLAVQSSPPSGNVIQGNTIGTDLTGLLPLGNAVDGIRDNGGQSNTIGGTGAGAGNLISANLGNGIHLMDASKDEVLGNIIGTTPGKITAAPYKFQPLGNQKSGILISGSTQNTIGGASAGAGNLIVANQNHGIYLAGGADSNVISGNAIGTTLASTSSIGIGPPVNLGNVSDGIFLSEVSANTIGGADQIDAKGNITLLGGNVVSSNGQAGIDVVGNDSSLPDNQGNVILGNLVGTGADGSRSVGNASIGIMVGSSANNTIGGINGLNPDGSLSSFNGNLVSGNQFGLQFNNTRTADNLAIGNRIGTDLSGTRAFPNAVDGVLITYGASNNTIGAANLDGSAANLISGNAQSGIEIQDQFLNGEVDVATDNHILGNRIGLTANGMATLPNLGDGILLNAAGNVIGGTASGAGNIISGNQGSGVRLTDALSLPGSSPDNNQILGNLIGLDVTGVSSGVGNVQSGVEVDNASGTTIGGVTSTAGTGPGNVISGNRQAGIHLTGTSTATVIEGNIIGLNAAGTGHQGNSLPGILLDGVSGNSVGGNEAGAGNVLSNNGTAGLAIENGSTKNQVQGNLIGTDPSGSVALGPIQDGVLILESTGNTIGGTDGLSGNLISGNGLSGVHISGSGASGNTVLGNRIGTDRSGTQPVSNGLDGVLLDSAVANTIGGTSPGARNLISANRVNGVAIRGTSTAPGQNNAVEGNLIGTTDSGAIPLGNAQDGVFLATGAIDNLIGGTAPAAGNLISANQSNGVDLFSGATGNQVLGNRIGTDLTGTFSLGNNNAGVMINDASGNAIGGPTSTTGRGAGNLISGNHSSGVVISGAGAAGNQVQGNLIGTDATGSQPLPNFTTGLTIDSASNNLVGGDQPGAGNVIAANRTFGVLVIGSDATGNRIAGNLIGTNSAGASNLGNALDGLIVNAAPANTIGGPAAGARNVISGNGGNGIDILNITGPDGIAIVGNFIGTDPAGRRALGNRLEGVLLNGVTGTVIAGASLPNLISGNSGSGIHSIGTGGASIILGNLIGTDISGTASLGNGSEGIALEDSGGNIVGGLAAGQGNLISGNVDHGIRIFSANSISNVLAGNTVGTDTMGTAPLGNGGYGISIEGTSNTLVQANLVSGNVSGGIQITGSGASGNNIYGCTIGTDRGGGTALGNGLASLNNGIGVFVNGAAGNRIGGGGDGQGNLISGNATAGVYIFGRFASGNTVQGNRIGTNAAGLHPLLQGRSTLIQQVGVLINQAPGLDLQDISPGPGNTIGGTTAGAGNLISGNDAGIEISGAESQGNVVSGNLIGPAGNGGSGAGNTVGVYVNGAPGNIIGGALGNVISGNSSVGVYILGSPSTGNQITGNFIGVGPDGKRHLPNQSGIFMENAPGNVIGGTSAASRNVISANLITGVYILGAQSVGNVVEGNLIGYAANGRTRAGNGQYGVLLYNAPANTVVRSGPNANRITGSGIASFREFTGRRVSANPAAGQKSQQPTTGRRTHRSASAQRRLVIGQATPAGPVRRKAHGMLARKGTR